MDNQISPVQSVPQASPAEKPKNWFKILLIFIGFLIVFGLFGNIYLLLRKENQKLFTSVVPTPTQTALLPTLTPDPTANWNTYSNEEIGISFKYPLGYVVNETQIMGKVRVAPKDKDKLPTVGNLDYEMGIDYLDNPQNLSSKQWLGNWVAELSKKEYNQKLIVSGRKEINVDNLVGEQAVFSYGGAFNPDIYTFVVNGNKVLRIFFAKGSPEYPVVQKQETIFNQVLLTFKFLQ